MKKIFGSRGSGKTTNLLRMASENEESIFVCVNTNYARELAHRQDLDETKIIFMSYEEFVRGDSRGMRVPVYIDEIECLLQYMNGCVEGYSGTI